MAQNVIMRVASLRRIIECLALAIASFLFTSCSEKEKIGGGYVLETSAAPGPDAHPGTSLHRKGRVVWDNVYVGYFGPKAASKFFHDGIFVFVGPLPGNTDWWTYPQLFAVRGEATPVVLSERLLGQRLVVSSDMREMSTFKVRQLISTEAGVRVDFEYWADSNTKTAKTNDLSWAEIKKLLDEAESSSRVVHHRFGDYRVLSLQ